MGKVLLWLVWTVELVLFIVGAGCVVMLVSLDGPDFRPQVAFALVLLVSSVALCGYGVFQGARAISRSESSTRLGLFLTLPVVAAFIFTGSCVLLINA